MKIVFLTIISMVVVVLILVWVKSGGQNLKLGDVFKSGPGKGLITGEKHKAQIAQNPNKAQTAQNPNAEVLDAEYTNSKYGFSFKHPSGFKVIYNPLEGGQEIITVEKDQSGPVPSEPEGFQIFILPFDEPFDFTQGKPGPITPERIKRDMPDLIIDNPQYISLDKTQALTFYSFDQDLGETYEVWFTHKGKLYQVTTYKKLSELVKQVVGTWKFK